MTTKLRKLDLAFSDCDLKFAGDKSKPGEFEGYASKFGGVDAYGDTIMPGAYRDSLEKKWPKMFFNHDSWEIPVGDWLKVEEDETGLYVVGKIDLNHKDGPSLHSAMKRKAVDGLSIGYRIPPGGAESNDTGGYNLLKIELKEISPVNFPADAEARITGVKYEIETISSLREAELFLRDAGIMSKSAATAFVSRVKAIANQRDAGSSVKDEIDAITAKMYRENVSGIAAILKNL